MVYKQIKRAVRRVGRKAYNKLKKRYVSKSGIRLGQVYKDVMHLKTLINVEKKRFEITTTSAIPVGQVNINSSAYYINDITPIPAQGITAFTRNGRSIKLSSLYMKFQFYQQGNTHQAVRLKIMFVLVKGSPESASTTIAQLFNSTAFVSPAQIDFNSERNPDYFGDYKVLRTVYCKVPCDQYTGSPQQVRIKDVTIGMKWMKGKGHHIRFYDDSTDLSGGQIMMVILADSGNINTATASTTVNIPVTQTGTGLLMNYNIRHYFVDN